MCLFVSLEQFNFAPGSQQCPGDGAILSNLLSVDKFVNCDRRRSVTKPTE